LTRSVIGACALSAAQHALPLARMVALEALDPPARMVPLRDRLAVGGGHQLVALAQEAPQAGVDEAGLRARRRVALGGLDRLVDQRERLVGRALGVPASASAVHSSASAGGGGVRLARWRRSASARPSQRSTWKPSACTPGRSAGSTASNATEPEVPARIDASATAVSCSWRQSGGCSDGAPLLLEESECRSDKLGRW
jgi:hypothetical protein